MTIKEQTIKRIEFQQEHNENDQKIYGRTSIFDRLELIYLEGVLQELEGLEELKKENEILKRENKKLKSILYAIKPECIVALESELFKQLGLEDNKENE